MRYQVLASPSAFLLVYAEQPQRARGTAGAALVVAEGDQVAKIAEGQVVGSVEELEEMAEAKTAGAGSIAEVEVVQ